MKQPANDLRCVVGVMTGTSIDGLDASLVEIKGRGLEMSARLMRHASKPLGELRTTLRAAADQKAMTAGEFARLALDFGRLHADAIELLMQEADLDARGLTLDAICVHGQTVFHQPPVSWQLINPAPIAARFACPVVFDLRQADLCAGGQGAPVTPLADWILFRHALHRRAIVNLGGFCNVTILPAGDSPALIRDIAGFDVCACNQVLDAVARLALGVSFDDRGAAARQGQYDKQASESLLAILRRQRSNNRSLGTGDEAMQWVQGHLTSLTPNDLAFNATLAIGHCISDAIAQHGVEEVIAAGGGARHELLLEVIEQKLELRLHRSDQLGVPIEARESMGFAVLGALCADRVPITLPTVTGCHGAPIAGSWLSQKTTQSCVCS